MDGSVVDAGVLGCRRVTAAFGMTGPVPEEPPTWSAGAVVNIAEVEEPLDAADAPA